MIAIAKGQLWKQHPTSEADVEIVFVVPDTDKIVIKYTRMGYETGYEVWDETTLLKYYKLQLPRAGETWFWCGSWVTIVGIVDDVVVWRCGESACASMIDGFMQHSFRKV